MTIGGRVRETADSNFTGIPSHDVWRFRDQLAPLVEKPLKRTDAGRYHTVESVLEKCANADWQCWVAFSDNIDCVFVTYMTDFPTGMRSFVVYLVGGTNIDHWLVEAWGTFKEYAKQNGCGEVVGMGRKGWLRALEKVEGKPLETHIRFSVEI